MPSPVYSKVNFPFFIRYFKISYLKPIRIVPRENNEKAASITLQKTMRRKLRY